MVFCCTARGRCYGYELTGIGNGENMEEARINAKKDLDVVGREYANTLDGGGTKPATESQIELIKSLCACKEMAVEQIIGNLFNKRIESLTGSDANYIIRNLIERNENF